MKRNQTSPWFTEKGEICSWTQSKSVIPGSPTRKSFSTSLSTFKMHSAVREIQYSGRKLSFLECPAPFQKRALKKFLIPWSVWRREEETWRDLRRNVCLTYYQSRFLCSSKEPSVAILRALCCNHTVAIWVYFAHHCRLFLPIFGRILNNAERIDPYVTYPKPSCDQDSVLECQR